MDTCGECLRSEPPGYKSCDAIDWVECLDVACAFKWYHVICVGLADCNLEVLQHATTHWLCKSCARRDGQAENGQLQPNDVGTGLNIAYDFQGRQIALLRFLHLGASHFEFLHNTVTFAAWRKAPKVELKTWLASHPDQESLPLQVFDEIYNSDPASFANTFRMSRECYDDLSYRVLPAISGSISGPKEPIDARVRLAITLQYLAHGSSYRTLEKLFRVSRVSISRHVPFVCEQIYNALEKEFIVFPATEDEWKMKASEFQRARDYPFCVGCIDGSHIAIVKPKNTGSLFYNYKNFHSVILLAVVDANYQFMYMSIGAAGI